MDGPLAGVAEKLKASGDLVLVDGDVSQKDTAIKVAEAAIRHFDRIDLLVNSAGIYIPKPFTEYTPEDFEMMIGTNVAGYFFITQQVVAHMRKQKSGHIVSISTVLTDQVHNSRVQPRPGDGIRVRWDSSQYDLSRRR